LAASVDPWFRGAANIAVAPDNTVSVEEAYIQTTSLGHGFSLKAGRFFSSIGYLNPQHSHTWDFVDNPLAYQAFLGTQYGDDGVQLAWIAPTDQYIELGVELGRGRSFPGTDTGRNGPGMVALIVHTGGDVGDSNSWRAGLSTLDAKADDQSLVATNSSGRTVTNAFSGSTRVWSPMRSGNGRRTAMPCTRTSNCKGSFCAASAVAHWTTTSPASTRPARTGRSNPAGTCRASTSRSATGVWACAPNK